MLNALGADECVATPPEIDFKILEYKEKEGHFGFATVNCGSNIRQATVEHYAVRGSDNCRVHWSHINERSLTISTALMKDAIYSVESIILCKGSFNIKTKKHGSNKELVSLKIPVNVAIIAFVCR